MAGYAQLFDESACENQNSEGLHRLSLFIISSECYLNHHKTIAEITELLVVGINELKQRERIYPCCIFPLERDVNTANRLKDAAKGTSRSSTFSSREEVYNI
jgi:hypothetical protein